MFSHPQEGDSHIVLLLRVIGRIESNDISRTFHETENGKPLEVIVTNAFFLYTNIENTFSINVLLQIHFFLKGSLLSHLFLVYYYVIEAYSIILFKSNP